jgi:YesN/AraC family two-component response regulator
METNMRIAEIAVSVGIVNRDYFSVLFKKNTGMRPQAYRDCYRQ